MVTEKKASDKAYPLLNRSQSGYTCLVRRNQRQWGRGVAQEMQYVSSAAFQHQLWRETDLWCTANCLCHTTSWSLGKHLFTVCINLPGCHSRYYSLGGLNNRTYFLIVLQTRSPRSRCQQVWFLLRFSHWLPNSTFSFCLHMVFSLHAQTSSAKNTSSLDEGPP